MNNHYNNGNGGNANNYQLQRNYQSSGSLCPQGSQLPLMYAATVGGQSTRGQSSVNLRGQQSHRASNVSVRDCMHWPESLAVTTGSNYASGNRYEGSSATMAQSQYGGGAVTYQPQLQQSRAGGMQVSYPQPKAFIQVPGQGQGEMRPMQIPCQMGPSGTQMAPLPPMEPLMIKVTAPPGAGANGQPIQFSISPNALYGGRY